MGVLADAQSWWKDKANTVLDNESFSVQDAGHALIASPTGASTDKDEFAKESSQFFHDINSVIATPGNEFAKATDDTFFDEGWVGAGLKTAGAGGEGAYELFVEDLGVIGYGTATGANTRTNDPDHATGGYTPGFLESLELAFIGGSGAIKGGKMLTKLDEGSGVLRTASKTDEAAAAAKAGDDAVETQSKLAASFANDADGAVGSLKLPDHLSWEAATGSITKAYRGTSYKKTKAAAVLGGGYISNALGLNDPPLPRGYTVDHTYTADPGGMRVKETDNADTLVGYWVVIGQDGGEFTVLGGGGGPVTTSTVDFPTTREPPFSSPQQANTAFEKWADSKRDTDPSGPTVDNTTTDEPDRSSEWEDVQVAKMLQPGWYLLSQGHKDSAKERFIVAGKDANARLLTISPSGSAKPSLSTYSSSKRAMKAYGKWQKAWSNDNAARVPDDGQQRPTTEEIQGLSRGGVLGSTMKTVGVAVGAAAVLYLLLRVVF